MQIYAENKKAHFDYEILEKYEAGLILIGQEVKSIRLGKANLTGSYVVMGSSSAKASADRQNEPYLIGAKIPAYQIKNAPNDYNPERSRKLLLNQKEIDYLTGRASERGFSLIPLKVYDKGGRIKLEFGLAKGKKKFMKKETIKKRQVKRDIDRELKS